MSFCVVGDLITHSGRQNERTTIIEFGLESTVQAEQNVPFATPMIGKIARAVLNHSDSSSAKLAGAPERRTGFAGMESGFYRRPIGGAKWNVGKLHGCLAPGRRMNRTEVPGRPIDTDLADFSNTHGGGCGTFEELRFAGSKK